MSSSNTKKIITIGAAVGFLGTFVSTLGIFFSFIEIPADIFLFLGRTVLLPVFPVFAQMPGIISITIFAAVNAVIYAVLFYLVYKSVRMFKKPRDIASQNTPTSGI